MDHQQPPYSPQPQQNQPSPNNAPPSGSPQGFNPAAGNAAAGSPSDGRPMQSPLYSDALPPVEPQGPSKMMLGLMGLGLFIAAGGIVFKIVHKPEPKPPVARAPSPWAEQQKLMREAMDMAREAQQMQREHQAEMRRAMEMDYGGGYSESDW